MKKDRGHSLAPGSTETLSESLEVQHALIIPEGATLLVQGDVDAETLFCEGTLRAKGLITIRQDAFCSGVVHAKEFHARHAVVSKNVSALEIESCVGETMEVKATFAFDEKHLAMPGRLLSSDARGGFDREAIQKALEKMKPLFKRSFRTPDRVADDEIQKKRQKSNGIASISFSRKEWPRAPLAIFGLTELQKLNLSSNRLESLPDALSQLTQLQKLNLQYNHLRQLPKAIGRCAALKDLHLGCNLLQTLPDSMASLSKLETLDFSFTNSSRTTTFAVPPPTEIPPVIFRMEALRELNLNLSHFERLPADVGRLKNLRKFSFGMSHLVHHLPDEMAGLRLDEFLFSGPRDVDVSKATPGETSPLFNMETLRVLSLDRWRMKTLARAISKLKNLESLELEFNALSSLPDDIQALTKLKTLGLRSNEFESFPEVLFEMPHLRSLTIDPSIYDKVKARFKKKLPHCDVKFG